MILMDKYSCILCKYKKYNKDKEYGCWEARGLDEYGYPIGECKSLSNIYYGTILKFFPFKQIHSLKTNFDFWRHDKHLAKMSNKYGNFALETDDIKFIWGVKSLYDLSDADACFYTMNDIDLTYDKKKKMYMLGVETAYMFKTHEAECDYLIGCLNAFTKYMDDNGLKKNKPYDLFMRDTYTSMTAETIEELYVGFKIFVDGFCNQDIDMDEKLCEKSI